MKWVFLLITALLASCSSNPKQTKHELNPDCVYVCSGQSAKRYHSVNDCMGLSRCSGEIAEMTIEDAENKGKTPCKMCVK